MSADRFNEDKLAWELVPLDALEGMVRVLMAGAEKYSADNWKKGYSWKKTSACLLRHLTAFLAGEDRDPETDLPHVHHMMCNALFLSYYYDNRPEYDDRDSLEEKLEDFDEMPWNVKESSFREEHHDEAMKSIAKNLTKDNTLCDIVRSVLGTIDLKHEVMKHHPDFYYWLENQPWKEEYYDGLLKRSNALVKDEPLLDVLRIAETSSFVMISAFLLDGSDTWDDRNKAWKDYYNQAL